MLNPTATTTVQSTVATNATVMEIDAEGMGTVLSILSNMYSNGFLAIVREYICNAIDSHAEAGVTDPVLVTAPSHFDPRLTVQDFGVGLSKDEMLGVYAKYGASTKRGSNDQIGAFGIGAKSAFTVGTQFVVTAVKDGEITVALFALDANGAPTVNIVQHGTTDEPNGVKVEIAVQNVEAVQRALDLLTSTLPIGSVLVDGVPPTNLWDRADKLAEDVHFLYDHTEGERLLDAGFLVVMGGVPYAVSRSVMNSLTARHQALVSNINYSSKTQVVLTVPIGAVDITPSREELRVTPKTTQTLDAMVAKFNTLFPDWLTDKVSSAESIVAAMILRRQLSRALRSVAGDWLDKVTWHGRPLLNTEVKTNLEYIELRRKRGGYGEKIARRYESLSLHPNGDLEKMLFVTDVPERRVRSVQLAAKPFLQQSSVDDFTMVVAVHAPTFSDSWFDLADPALHTISYDEFIAQWKPARAPGSASRGATRYWIGEVESDDKLTAAELVELDDVLYLTYEQHANLGQGARFLKPIADQNTLVILNQRQRLNVLLMKVSGAKPALPLMRKEAEKMLLTVTQDDLDTLAAIEYMSNVNREMFNYLVGRRNSITHPFVIKVLDQFVRANTLYHNNLTRLRELQAVASFVGKSLESKSTINSKDAESLIRRFPLITIYLGAGTWRRTSDTEQHILDYMNNPAL